METLTTACAYLITGFLYSSPVLLAVAIGYNIYQDWMEGK